MLSQAVYWSRRTNEDSGWFYKTQAEWEEETGLTRSEQETARSKLCKIGVLQERKKGIPCKLFYRVSFEGIAASLGASHAQTGVQKPSTPVCGNPANSGATFQQPIYTETTSETTQSNTPIPPAPQAPGASGSKATAISLATWLSNLKASGELPIPEDDPVFTYAEQAGIPLEMLRLCWIEFRSRYSEPGAKRYKDWRSVYRKAVRGNWLKLWFCNADGYTLTTAGLQAQRALQAKEGAAA